MFELSNGDWILLAIAGFIAITSLVRLMQRQRRIVFAKLESEVAAEQQRQEAEKKEGKSDKGKPVARKVPAVKR